MTSTLFIIQIVLAVVLTIAVLLQKSSSIGLGAYSGSNESVFGAKGPTGFLSKFTFIIAFVFIINTLSLGYLYTSKNGASVTDMDMKPTNNKLVPTPLSAPKSSNTTTTQAPLAPKTK